MTRMVEPENQQALEPVEQEEVPFKNETIVAVRLSDGRICIVLRWVCRSLHLDPQGQVQRIERTASTSKELVRVRVQTGGGRQTMPAITLRGFSPWVLGLNPNEIRSDNPAEDERIRVLIVAYQEEAKDVLYEHFVNKRRSILPAAVPAEPVKPQEVEPNATDVELATYYENLALWALWKAGQHAQRWRGETEVWRGAIENRLEGQEAMSGLLPEILERLGPEKLTSKHRNQVKGYAQQLSKATGKHWQTIYTDLYTAFEVAQYEDILEDDWPKVEQWFTVQIERAKKK